MLRGVGALHLVPVPASGIGTGVSRPTEESCSHGTNLPKAVATLREPFFAEKFVIGYILALHTLDLNTRDEYQIVACASTFIATARPPERHGCCF